MEEININSIRKQWRNAEDCWLAPNGTIHKCEKLGHSIKAKELLNKIYKEDYIDLEQSCERLHQHGWARYSTFGTIEWVYTRHLTQQQIDEMYFYSGHKPE